jgi:hypothetical protein
VAGTTVQQSCAVQPPSPPHATAHGVFDRLYGSPEQSNTTRGPPEDVGQVVDGGARDDGLSPPVLLQVTAQHARKHTPTVS